MKTQVVLKKPPRGALRFGHPWVYRSQVREIRGEAVPGGLADIRAESGKLLGVGYFNPKSQILARLLSRQDVPIDVGFFKSRFEKALDYRSRVVRDTNAYRVASSEADDLPGLIVDRYGEILVVQFLTLGMEHLRPIVISALEEALPAKGIYERSDSQSRGLEGLAARSGWIRKDCGAEVEVYEGSIRYALTFGEGHKTGLYLDQRENRLLLAQMGIRGEALDAFCYEGGFGLHLARAGLRVLGVESQEEAVARGRAHQKLNGISADGLEWKIGNVFDELKTLEKAGRRFDLVILDPPSFAKKKSAVAGAVSGYKEIVLRGMKLLKEPGWLAVFSCSYHLDETRLMETCLAAAYDVRRSLRVVRFLKQAADHPIHPFIPETYYLKGFLFFISNL